MLRLVALTAILGTPAAALAAAGMPQLDFANPLTISQIVWGAVIFLALYLVLSKSALPQVNEVLQARQTRIQADLDTARQAKAQADQAAAESDTAERRARAESQAQVADAMAAAKVEATAQAHEAEERLNAQLSTAEARINEARNAAMGALREVATEAASSLVTRLTGRTPDASTVDAAVGGVLASQRAA